MDKINRFLCSERNDSEMKWKIHNKIGFKIRGGLKKPKIASDILYLKILRHSRIQKTYPSERFGSDYGGYVTCPIGLTKESIVYSFGVGEDISWDEELIAKYGVRVFGFDPTPKSAIYIQQKNPHNFDFFQIGISNHNGILKFYPPRNEDYVSCSLFKHQDSNEEPILVKIVTLDKIMRKLGHEKIDILKMDIEGAEYEVIEDIIEKSIFPGQILIEFHHKFKPFSISDTKNRFTFL